MKKTRVVSRSLPLRPVLLAFVVLFAILPILFAAQPTWWSGILNSNSRNDFGTVNQGQVKNIAKAAMGQLDQRLSAGAGDAVHALVSSWGTTASPTDFAAINVGQLKNLVTPFYDRLIDAGYVDSYPWATVAETGNDFAMANVGQVKYLFGFDLSGFVENPVAEQLPAWWQLHYFGQTSGVDPNGNADGDGFTNLQEYLNGTNPTVADNTQTPAPGGGGSPVLDADPEVWNGGLSYNVSSSDSSTITLSWSDATPSITAFVLQKKVSTGSWQQVTTLNSTTTSYDQSGHRANETVHYRIYPVVNNTLGGPSNEVAYKVGDLKKFESHRVHAYGEKGGYGTAAGGYQGRTEVTHYTHQSFYKTLNPKTNKNAAATDSYTATAFGRLDFVSADYPNAGHYVPATYPGGPGSFINTTYQDPYLETDFHQDVESSLPLFPSIWGTGISMGRGNAGILAERNTNDPGHSIDWTYYRVINGQYKITLNKGKAGRVYKWAEVFVKDNSGGVGLYQDRTEVKAVRSLSLSGSEVTSPVYTINGNTAPEDGVYYVEELGELQIHSQSYNDPGLLDSDEKAQGVTVPVLKSNIAESQYEAGEFFIPVFIEGVKFSLDWTLSSKFEVWAQYNGVWQKIEPEQMLNWENDYFPYSHFRIVAKTGVVDKQFTTLTLTAYGKDGTTLMTDTAKFIYSDPTSLEVPVDDASGAKNRKIALNGRPLPDGKPQTAEESDQQPEETFIDAMTLGLRHSTTDAYVPVPGSELNLSVRRNTQSDVWNMRNGLRPNERWDSPFGVAWNSNLGSNIRIEETFYSGQMQLVYAYVTDENGAVSRFATWKEYEGDTHYAHDFFPFPTAKHEQATYLSSLQYDEANHRFTFKRKFGSTLVYDMPTDSNGNPVIMRKVSTDRLIGSESYVVTTYARLTSVQDRLQQEIKYNYSSTQTLIPSTITVTGRPDLKVSIKQENFSTVANKPVYLISSIWDANGNETKYGYTKDSVNGVWQLTSVTMPDGAKTTYSYEFATEQDLEPKPATSLDPGVTYIHCDVKSIEDPNHHTYTFDYMLDHDTNPATGQAWHGKYNYKYSSEDPSLEGYYLTTGHPRMVKTVTLPGNIGSTTFENLSIQKLVASTPGGAAVFTADSQRAVKVTDTENISRTYTWSDAVVYPMTKFQDLSQVSNQNCPMIVYYKKMTVDYGTGVGSEVFEFDPNAGLALVAVTDICGNKTSYAYTDTWTAPTGYRDLLPANSGLNGVYEDPSSQTNALGHDALGHPNVPGHTKSFYYDATTRIMNKVVDELGRMTVYGVDGQGRRTSEKIYDSVTASSPVQWTKFLYESSSYPGFMTKKVVMNSADSPFPLITQFVPDSNGRIDSEIVNLSPSATEFTNLTTLPANQKLVTKYTYDKNGNKLTATDPLNHVTKFNYDNRNRLKNVVYHDLSQKNFIYDSRGNKVKEVDENGNATLFVYDVMNRLEAQARDMNNNGLVDSRSIDLVTSCTYDKVNAKLTETDPRGNTTTHSYTDPAKPFATALHLLQSTTTPGVTEAPGGYKTKFEYDPALNCGGSAFDSSGFKPTRITDPRNYVTEITYDKLYRATSKKVQYQLTPALNAITGTEYDDVGNLRTTVDPRLKRTEMDYDALNRPTVTRFAVTTPGQVNPAYGYTRLFYSSIGLKWKVRDEEGRETTTEFDSAGRARFVKSELVNRGDDVFEHAITETVYDAAGNVLATINPRFKRWDYSYDVRNRKTDEYGPSVFDGNSKQTVRPHRKTFYDAAGNVVQATDARGKSMYSIYDRANRVTHQVSPSARVMLADGSTSTLFTVTRTEHDANGNVLRAYRGGVRGLNTIRKAANPNAVTLIEQLKTADNAYDALGRLKTVTDAANITVVSEYDAAGNKTAVIDGKLQKTRFEYDGLNRNTKVTYPQANGAPDVAGLFEKFDYNELNKTGRTDCRNEHVTYDYDNRHRLETVTYTERPQENRTYTYDKVGNLLTVTEPNGTGKGNVGYTYDELNRQKTETSGGIEHTYRYDLAGNRLKVIYGGTNKTLISTYDDANRLNTLIESARTTSYEYDLNGNVTKLTQPNSDTTQKIFDALNRPENIITSAGGSELSRYTDSYDLAGNVRKIVEDYRSGSLSDRVVVNTYDTIDRLNVEAVTTDGQTVTTTYLYDDANNRSKMTVAGGPHPGVTDYIYNNLNQLTSASGVLNASYSYDNNGNRETRTVGGATDHYVYDGENRLVSLSKATPGGPGGYNYAYDYRTRRVERVENGAATKLVFSGGTSVQEYSGASLNVEYVRGSDYGGGVGGILYSLRGGSASFNHYNNRGDVAAKTDGNGALTYEAAYGAFGDHPVETGATQDRQKANTKDEDPTGLLNEGFRYRDLETGTFITRDPAGFVDGPNLYCYVQQNPWSKFDPEGLTGFWSDFASGCANSVFGIGGVGDRFGQGLLETARVGSDICGTAMCAASDVFGTNTMENFEGYSQTYKQIAAHPENYNADTMTKDILVGGVKAEANVATFGAYGYTEGAVTGNWNQAQDSAFSSAVFTGVAKVTNLKPGPVSSSDQALVNELISSRAESGASGDATLGMGESSAGARTPIAESAGDGVNPAPKELHAEPQVLRNMTGGWLKNLYMGRGWNTIAVDQNPCPSCSTKINMTPGTRVVTPSNLKGNSPKSAAIKASQGKMPATAKEVMKSPRPNAVIVPKDKNDGS